MAASAAVEDYPLAPHALRGLFEELNDLKRIRSAGRRGSIAERLFAQAWSALTAGEGLDDAMRHVTAAAMAAARLGDLDRAALEAGGLAAEETAAVLQRAFDAVAGNVPEPLRTRLRDTLGEIGGLTSGSLPAFAGALAEQPRAGVTWPGRPRIVLEPPENHAEHCLIVAVYGVLLSPAYGADPQLVFLAGLAHHLHNASLPDSGFTGEMLLEEHLWPLIERATEAALDELEPPLRAGVELAREILPDAETPEGQAFHAADVIDRFLQIRHHLGATSLSMGAVLGEMELVHDGPVKPFHDEVVAAMGLTAWSRSACTLP